MLWFHRVLRAVGFSGGLFLAASMLSGQSTTLPAEQAGAGWSTADAKHVYGLLEVKPGRKGSLRLSPEELRFSSKSIEESIRRDRILSVSSGSERVELWGTTGQVVRLMIPQGGGLAAAAVLHHRVGMLTIDYLDARGGKHAVVFGMSPAAADAALTAFSTAPFAVRAFAAPAACDGGTVDPSSIRVLTPNWEAAEVPAAYRALMLEHVFTRLQAVKGVGRVLREGETQPGDVCTGHTIRIAVKEFKPGNQVKRAALGPVGLFVGTTQIAFEVNLTDASGRLNRSESVKASMRTQSESTAVADKFAKLLAKHYVAALREQEAGAKQTAPVAAAGFR